ncbi:MAG: hypothetical protein GY880_30145, partial [Planctomycetaceae bacterium]|nr:hypothetical protein [Planctomycetaceae bacterium]
MAKFAQLNRRSAIKATLGMAAVSLGSGTVDRALGFKSANSRPRIGVIGCGVRWDKRVFETDGRYGVGKEFPKYGDVVAVCDVDAIRLGRAKGIVKDWLGKDPLVASDYRKIIDNPNIDVVHISTPDHWHA